MAVQTESRITLAAFEALAILPDNADKRLEYVGGIVNEVVSNSYAAEIAAILLIAIGGFVQKQQLGRVTGPDGGYQIAGERYIPDVAYLSYAKQPKATRAAYNPNTPDLVVEVISNPGSYEEMNTLRIKIANYLSDSVWVWVVDPNEKRVEIYRQGQAVQILSGGDVIEGGDVLPGFKLSVQGIFPEEETTIS